MLNELTRPSPHPTPHLAALEPLFGGFVPQDGVVQTQPMHRLLQTDRVSGVVHNNGNAGAASLAIAMTAADWQRATHFVRQVVG